MLITGDPCVCVVRERGELSAFGSIFCKSKTSVKKKSLLIKKEIQTLTYCSEIAEHQRQEKTLKAATGEKPIT